MDFESLKKISLVAEAVFNINNISSLKRMRGFSVSLAHVRGFFWTSVIYLSNFSRELSSSVLGLLARLEDRSVAMEAFNILFAFLHWLWRWPVCLAYISFSYFFKKRGKKRKQRKYSAVHRTVIKNSWEAYKRYCLCEKRDSCDGLLGKCVQMVVGRGMMTTWLINEIQKALNWWSF